jgi:hypothetical protein
MADHVDLVLEQRRERRPELDASPMGILGRMGRLNHLIDAVLPTHVDTESELLAGLSTAERDQLAGLLRTLLESLGDKRV